VHCYTPWPASSSRTRAPGRVWQLLTPPGLVPISQWGLAGQIDTTVGGLVGYCGIGKKR